MINLGRLKKWTMLKSMALLKAITIYCYCKCYRFLTTLGESYCF